MSSNNQFEARMFSIKILTFRAPMVACEPWEIIININIISSFYRLVEAAARPM